METGSWGRGAQMDGWMDGRREDRMTGWQNRVKDTLQYYVTARRAHKGPREPRGREKKKKIGRRKPEKQEVKHLWFLFSLASITWSVMGGETVRIRDVEEEPTRQQLTLHAIWFTRWSYCNTILIQLNPINLYQVYSFDGTEPLALRTTLALCHYGKPVPTQPSI